MPMIRIILKGILLASHLDSDMHLTGIYLLITEASTGYAWLSGKEKLGHDYNLVEYLMALV